MNLQPLPSNWTWKTLIETALPVKNAIADGPFGSSLKTCHYVDKGVPVLQGKNITEDNFRMFDIRFITESKANELRRSWIQLGDILLIKIGSIGYSAVVDNLDNFQKAVIPANMAKITPNPDVIDTRYLYRWLTSNQVKRHLRQVASKTAQPALNLTKIKDLPVPLPPLPKQKRIAEILDKANAIRRKRKKAISLTEEFLRSAFLDMFGDLKSPNGKWPEVTLGEIVILDAPMVNPLKEQYLDLLHIGPDRIEKGTGRMLPAQTAKDDRLISGKFLFDERYLLYSKIRPYLRKVALPSFTGLCSADVYPIRPVNGKTTREFLFSLLISKGFLAYTESLPSRASIPKLNRKELAKFRLRLPPFYLQEEYSKLLQNKNKVSKRFEQTQTYTNNLFNSLVQRAFRGELTG